MLTLDATVGVGKTAIAEGLAQRIASGEVPESMKDKRVLRLDVTAMVSGAMFRGTLEMPHRVFYEKYSSLYVTN